MIARATTLKNTLKRYVKSVEVVKPLRLPIKVSPYQSDDPEQQATLKQAQDSGLEDNPMPNWASVLYPAANLYQVDEGLFRSEQLEAEDAPLLIQYHIDSMINLRFFDRNNNQQHFAGLPQLQGVAFYSCPLTPWYITPQQLAEILSLIDRLQSRGKTILVHCYHGADRTGIVIAMYRIVIQNWSIAHAKAEMMQGNFGYHAFWRNLENMLNPDTVEQVRTAYHQILV